MPWIAVHQILETLTSNQTRNPKIEPALSIFALFTPSKTRFKPKSWLKLWRLLDEIHTLFNVIRALFNWFEHCTARFEKVNRAVLCWLEGRADMIQQFRTRFSHFEVISCIIQLISRLVLESTTTDFILLGLNLRFWCIWLLIVGLIVGVWLFWLLWLGVDYLGVLELICDWVDRVWFWFCWFMGWFGVGLSIENGSYS